MNVSLFCCFVFFLCGLYSGEFINAKEFIKKNIHSSFVKQKISKRELPEWMKTSIEQEFQQVEPFTLDDLEKTFNEATESILHFRVRDGIMSFKSNRPGIFHPIPDFVNILTSLLRQPWCDLKSGDFLLELWDTVEDRTSKCPILCFSKFKESNYICIPDWFACGKDREPLMKEIDLATEQISWESKKELGFWIGAANGNFTSLEEWKKNSRAQLTLFSIDHPDLVWARFLSLKGQGHICPEISALDDLVGAQNRVSPYESCRYKYLMDVDGFGCAYHRTQWILRSSSVLVKENSRGWQWFYPGLKPYVHYVPFKSDCSDLKEVIFWLRENDSKAKEIALAGRDFCNDYLSKEITYLYLYQVLKKYNELNKSL